MGPIDYTQDLANPMQQALQGYAIGQALNQQRVAREQAAVQAQAEQARQAEISRVLGNPQATAEERARIVTMLPPQVSAQLQTVWKQASEDQANAMLGFDTQVFAALDNGRADLAVQLYEDRAKALEASGRGEEAKRFRQQAAMAKDNPALARNLTAMRIDAAGDRGAKVWESYAKRGGEDRAQAQAPAALRKLEAEASGAESDATTKAVTAKYADSMALRELESKGWGIEALKADIEFKRQSTRIAAMNAALAREGNDLKRQELQMKLDAAKSERDAKLRERVATAESGATAIDNMLNTIERIKRNPALRDVVGPLEGRDLYPTTLAGTISPPMLTTSADQRTDAIALIETLGSQAFLAQIPNIKGMGALSNAEGEKLQAALQNLKRTQSEGQFTANLEEAARILLKGRDSLARSTGVPLPKPDTPAKPTQPAGNVSVSGW